MKQKNRIITIAVIAILFACIAFSWFGETASQKERIELEFRGTFIMVIYSLMYGTVLGTRIDNGLIGIFENLQGIVLMNPPLQYHMIHNIIRYFIVILEPLYITSLLVTALYLIFVSGSPAGRRKAKGLLPLLIASAVAISLTFQILTILFNTSQELSIEIIKVANVDVTEIFLETIEDLMQLFTASTLNLFEGGFFFLLLIFFMITGVFTVLTLRYIVLLFFTMIFPIGIFLYTFEFSRGMGRFILEQTILWTFVQVLIIVILVVVNMGVSVFGITDDLRTIIGVTSFIAVIVSPLILITLIKRFLP